MILVTGGAGYIGSHTVVALLEAGHQVVVVDNLCNSSEASLARVREITGKDFVFYPADVRDFDQMDKICKDHAIDTVIHFAGLKAVGESVAKPISYYQNNLESTTTLLRVMENNQIKKIIFSSSATVYRADNPMPLTEDANLGCTNPYGWTKFMCEQIITDVVKANPDWSGVLLRYFNPIGAHKSGRIGEQPAGIPNNLLPYITQVAVGKLAELSVNGNDYDTKDGTGVRDYIHVTDLAKGHMAAIDYASKNTGVGVFNLGTGKGVSVMDMVNTFEKVNGVKVPYKIAPRRPGDIGTNYASPAKAMAELGWKAELSLEEALADSWRWQSNNPNGY